MNLLEHLKCLLVQTQYNIYELEQINKLAPYLAGCVDIVLETDSYIICFKDFWTCNNLKQEILNSYLYDLQQINSINNSNTNLGKKYIFVLLVKSSHCNLGNEILNSQNIYVIKKFNQNKLIKKITYFLYSNNIFFYEPDNSAIMLE